jgi:glyoxylase-like metal-dependent hydrolase (beta-lactamase superfamily II)
VTSAPAALADRLPGWAALVRAPNPGPMSLDGTNTWVLRPTPAVPAVVIDPGPLDEGHLRAVAATGPVSTVLVTHHHPDHVEGLSRFVALTGARVGVGDGIPAALNVRVLPTPGHTADSVCFDIAVAGERAVFTGDTILGRGTSVVAWPDGDLGDYLDSLELLSAYSDVPALPGHGPALADCGAAARFYLAHRRARLDQVRAVVAAGATTSAAVVDAVYGDIDAGLRDAAEWSVRAQLRYLSRESGDAAGGLDQP